MPEITVEIGRMPIRLRSADSSFLDLLRSRYDGFIRPTAQTDLIVDIQATESMCAPQSGSLRLSAERGTWVLDRDDLQAEWDCQFRNVTVRQAREPFLTDLIIRALHSYHLAKAGGLLIHAASATRGGRGFLFAGVSGAGKTTISRLAPPDVTLLSDETSYVRGGPNGYEVFGTPFSSSEPVLGTNARAPVAAVFFLARGTGNLVERVSKGLALRSFLKSVWCFSRKADLSRLLFDIAVDFVDRVPAYRLTFAPDPAVWDLIK